MISPPGPIPIKHFSARLIFSTLFGKMFWASNRSALNQRSIKLWSKYSLQDWALECFVVVKWQHKCPLLNYSFLVSCVSQVVIVLASTPTIQVRIPVKPTDFSVKIVFQKNENKHKRARGWHIWKINFSFADTIMH